MKNISKSAQSAAALVAVATLIISIWQVFAASAQVEQTPGIENEFHSALSRPLEERTALLEALEQKVAEALSAGTLTKRDALRLKFLIQKELGHYAQACKNCDEYLQAVKPLDTLQPSIVTFVKPMPLQTSAVRLTKYSIKQKTFYYVHFLNREPPSSIDTNSPGPVNEAAFTIMLGYVPDNSDQFVPAKALYYNFEGPAIGKILRIDEINYRFDGLREAVILAEQRLTARIRANITDVQNWLERPSDFPPTIANVEIKALAEIRSLKTNLFGVLQ